MELSNIVSALIGGVAGSLSAWLFQLRQIRRQERFQLELQERQEKFQRELDLQREFRQSLDQIRSRVFFQSSSTRSAPASEDASETTSKA